MHDVIVVGAGIMGATIGEAFRQIQDRDVLIIDGNHDMSGTRPSGGSVKPSKLTGLTHDEEQPALGILERLFGLHKENFVIRPSGGLLKADVYQISMDKVFGVDNIFGEVTKVAHNKSGYPAVAYNDDHDERRVVFAPLVVVAAGIGCADLFPKFFGDDLFAKTGVSFLFSGSVKQAFVQAWAPYKQITVHNYGKYYTWGSDGSALKPENWDDVRTLECRDRIMKAMGSKTSMPDYTFLGLRPFHKSKAKPCFMKEISDGIWVVTGAGKFGSISAGWAASKLLKI